MKRLIATVGISLALILSLHDADAMWPELSQMELIEQSNLIVTGSLIGRTAVAVQPEGVNLTLGVIKIETVLKGDENQSVTLLILPSRSGLVLAGIIDYKVGQKGLWFLRLRTSQDHGLYLADHPQRFVPMAKAAGRIDALKKILKR